MSKLIVVIQCDKVVHRCSGFACARAFYQRTGKFQDYAEDARYMSMSCGGCCGADVAAKLGHLKRKLAAAPDFGSAEDIVVHLSSCITSVNFHHGPCPFKNYLVKLIEGKGLSAVEGTYVSKKAEAKRAQGIYKEF